MEEQVFILETAYRWKMLGVAYSCMFSYALVFQSIPPLLSWIIEELQISHAQAGLLMSLFALPGIFVAVPAGAISDCFGVKKVAFPSLFLVIAGTLVVVVGNSFLIVCMGRIISGLGAVTLSIVSPQMLSKWFLGRELGVSMGIFNTAMPLGTILSFNAFSIVDKIFGWRFPIFITTLTSIFALLIFLEFFREPSHQINEAKSNTVTSIKGLGFSMWLVGLAWMWFNAAFISFLTFATDFFVGKGYERGFAGFMSSIVMMGALLISPLVGYALHRFGKEELFVGLGGLVLAIFFVLFPSASLDIPMLVVIAITVAFTPPSIFSLPSKVAPKNLGLGFGVLSMCTNIGMLVGPYLAGLARDLTHTYVLSFYLIAFFAVLETLAIVFFYFLRHSHSFNC
jgi:predicted MFS family arabinose efflux permease